MKRLIVVAYALIIGKLAFAQEKERIHFKKEFSVSARVDYRKFYGNNFVAKTYEPAYPLYIDWQFNIYRNWGFGTYYQGNRSTLKSTEYVGLSFKNSMENYGLYCIHYLPVTKRLLFIPKIGVSYFVLKNKLLDVDNTTDYTYKSKGYNFNIGGEAHLFLLKWASVYSNVGFEYYSFPNISASPQIGVSYRHSNALSVGLGVRCWVGK